jgi:hypothetical protein
VNIVTANGHEVDMRYPRSSAIVLADISHHLATINRFTGAACRPYSVAEHSLLVCEIVEREMRLPLEARLAALMHDAHEAYVGDVHTPAKAEIGAAWYDFERKFEHLVRGCFHLSEAAATWAVAIKQADLIALATERAQLLPPSATPWQSLHHVTPVGWVNLMDRGRVSMTWQDWRAAFEDKVNELDYGRNLPHTGGRGDAVRHHPV